MDKRPDVKEVLAKNLEYLMEYFREVKQQPELGSRMGISKAIGTKSKGKLRLSPAALDNVMHQRTAISIDNLEKIAAVLDIPAYFLLAPGLDLLSPPGYVDPETLARMREQAAELNQFFNQHGGLHDVKVGRSGMGTDGSAGEDGDGASGNRLPKKSTTKRAHKAK